MIAGDTAYPLLPWILKPYFGSQLNPAQESFNYYLSSTCIVVENAFGKLKARWHLLNKRMQVHIKKVPTVIAACCILHNKCEEEHTPKPEETIAKTDLEYNLIILICDQTTHRDISLICFS